MSSNNNRTMMGRKTIILFLLFLSAGFCAAQKTTSTAELFRNDDRRYGAGTLTINHDPRIDTLINRYILYNMRQRGMEGFRIQIYNSSEMNAREESGKIRAEFIGQFPDIVSYATFDRPSYYKIRVGDYRTRIEGTRDLMMIRRVFPDAILVPDIINFPDLN
ncbi:MAG: SPOR domain-containing protein [Bacteroidales bacterium]|nr:SPOR domain-containing protein [Bacteroidales bacterium]